MAQRIPFDPYTCFWRQEARKRNSSPNKVAKSSYADAAAILLLILTVFMLGLACGEVVAAK